METTLISAAYGDFLVEYVKGLKSKLRQGVHCKVVIKAIIKIEVVYEIQTKSFNSETVVMVFDYLKNLSEQETALHYPFSSLLEKTLMDMM